MHKRRVPLLRQGPQALMVGGVCATVLLLGYFFGNVTLDVLPLSNGRGSRFTESGQAVPAAVLGRMCSTPHTPAHPLRPAPLQPVPPAACPPCGLRSQTSTGHPKLGHGSRHTCRYRLPSLLVGSRSATLARSSTLRAAAVAESLGPLTSDLAEKFTDARWLVGCFDRWLATSSCSC